MRKDEFHYIIRVVTKTRLSNLPDLHTMIRRYRGNTVELPRTIRKCREYVKTNIFVNIYDFNHQGNNKQFENVNDLSEYTIRKRKKFPREEAKEDEILADLLHYIRIRR